MTNSKIRNFFKTLQSIKEDALLPYVFISENQMRSLNCRQTIYSRLSITRTRTHGESKIVRVIESSSNRELLMRIY